MVRDTVAVLLRFFVTSFMRMSFPLGLFCAVVSIPVWQSVDSTNAKGISAVQYDMFCSSMIFILFTLSLLTYDELLSLSVVSLGIPSASVYWLSLMDSSSMLFTDDTMLTFMLASFYPALWSSDMRLPLKLNLPSICIDLCRSFGRTSSSRLLPPLSKLRRTCFECDVL